MKQKIANLIDVKSLVTLILAGVFCFLAITNAISGSEFLTIFTVVISFYFGTVAKKSEIASVASQADDNSILTDVSATESISDDTTVK